jgi:hypothetical protein
MQKDTTASILTAIDRYQTLTYAQVLAIYNVLDHQLDPMSDTEDLHKTLFRFVPVVIEKCVGQHPGTLGTFVGSKAYKVLVQFALVSYSEEVIQ